MATNTSEALPVDPQWVPVLEDFEKFGAPASTKLQGHTFYHYRNGKPYIFLSLTQIQVDDVWVSAVSYRLKGHPTTFVRSLTEFTQKFKWPLPRPDTPMCRKLGNKHRERLVLCNFVIYCQEQDGADERSVLDLHPEKTVFEFLDIDVVELERERRELLDYERRRYIEDCNGQSG